MSLNEEEIQQLELLALLRENGKLTDEQFQLQTSAILRSSAVRRAPAHPFIKRIFGSPGVVRKKAQGTKRKSLVPTPNREVILERHLLPDQFLPEQVPSSSVFPDENERAKYAERKRKPSLSTLVSMRTDDNQRRTSLLTTLATVTSAIVLTSLISSSAPLESVIERIDKQPQATVVAMQPVTKEVEPQFVEPFFGPIAERRCQSICAGRSANEQQYCFASCSRFSLEEYGRRITLTPLSPESEAKEILYACDSKPIGKRDPLSETEWNARAAEQTDLFAQATEDRLSKDFGSTRLRFERSSSVANSFFHKTGSSTSERRFSEKLIRTACIRAHISLAELGISVASETSDSFSKRFYQTLHRALRKESFERERAIVKMAKSIGVLDE